MKTKIEQAWSLVPVIKCKGLCTESCGPIACSKGEMQLIEKYCKENNITLIPIPEKVSILKLMEDFTKESDELTCPYLKDGKCSIYSVRPLICRLWGVVNGMPCMFGCEIQGAMLNDKQAHHLLDVLDKP